VSWVPEIVLAEDVLSATELAAVTAYVVGREADFVASHVIWGGTGAKEFVRAQSQVLLDMAEHEAALAGRVRSALDHAAAQRQVGCVTFSRFEAGLHALLPGGSLIARGEVALPSTRAIAFLYFFSPSTAAFQGAELHVHDMREENGRVETTTPFKSVAPRSNLLVLFRHGLSYEIVVPDSATRRFGDSLFVIQGWLHR
jgi:hypothetical protein